MCNRTSNIDLFYLEYTQDSEVSYNGEMDEDKFLKAVSLKGVRIA